MKNNLMMARLIQPVTLVLSLTLWIPGLLAIIYGEDVSRGLTVLGVGFLARVMGVSVLVGSISVVFSILKGRSTAEIIGLMLLGFGLIIYGIGVMFGLGLNGVFAGPVALSLAAALMYRAKLIPAIAIEYSQRHES